MGDDCSVLAGGGRYTYGVSPLDAAEIDKKREGYHEEGGGAAAVGASCSDLVLHSSVGISGEEGRLDVARKEKRKRWIEDSSNEMGNESLEVAECDGEQEGTSTIVAVEVTVSPGVATEMSTSVVCVASLGLGSRSSKRLAAAKAKAEAAVLAATVEGKATKKQRQSIPLQICLAAGGDGDTTVSPGAKGK